MSTAELVSTIAALAAVLLLAIGLGRVARWRGVSLAAGRRSLDHALAIRSSVSIDTKRRLLLVSCRDRELIVLTGPHGDALLDWRADPMSGSLVSEAIGR